MTDRVEIFTDGACKGNPGPGGWGALLRVNGQSKELKGSEPETTNNRMEMQAVISALESLKQPCSVQLTTDSKYVLDGVKSWMPNWKKRGWKTASKAPVKNKDLWMKIDVLVQAHDIEWAWVKGHSGHVENERVDQLANDAIDEMQRT
ncbi:ribonuclease HI [Gammaproteobacteria bacterium]|jgi:ribonuclease HI|nr:ribonuclease HI [Pseudomonadota bacterium]MDB0063861.1 ribonuclease HI [Gammaproteobacteria bacterium]MDC1284531.1 ribonuclease HI [Gammaproteobacteria bacterium]